jgi:hypothetical protein
MRAIAILGLALAIGVAACGGSKDAAPTTWNGPERPYPADGALPVEEFNAYADATEGNWKQDPEQLALEFTQVHGAEATVEGAEVTLLRDDLEDDSVRAERYVLHVRPEGDEWRLVSAQWEQQCHQNRGHQDFSPALCV